VHLVGFIIKKGGDYSHRYARTRVPPARLILLQSREHNWRIIQPFQSWE